LLIASTGQLLANGGGGKGGCLNGGGGGGGAGGGLFLEAPRISILNEATITANGGGGGGAGSTINVGVDGQNGLAALFPAAGGPMEGSTGGSGGTGGTDSAGAGPGDPATYTGGGGGAVGRIVLRAITIEDDESDNSIFSPFPAKLVVARPS
jgi:hypothetical protein